VTPTTSPPDDEKSFPKQLLKKPVKQKLENVPIKKKNKKSLDYRDETGIYRMLFGLDENLFWIQI